MSRIRDTFATLAARANFGYWGDFLELSEDAQQPTVVQYNIEGEDAGIWQVVIDNRNPTCAVHESSAKAPDLRLTLSAVDWLDIVAGRSSVFPLLASGSVRAEGNRELLGVLVVLGLLGPSVTPAELATHEHDGWIASAPGFVLPRVLTAGRIDYHKWCHFVDLGDLKATVAERAEWRALREPPARRHAKLLGSVLRPVWWRHSLMDTPLFRSVLRLALFFCGTRGKLAAICLILVMIAGLALAPWWALLLVGAIISFILVTGYALVTLDEVHRRASVVLTRLACVDPDFFCFALERGLMQISPNWGEGDKPAHVLLLPPRLARWWAEASDIGREEG